MGTKTLLALSIPEKEGIGELLKSLTAAEITGTIGNALSDLVESKFNTAVDVRCEFGNLYFVKEQ